MVCDAQCLGVHFKSTDAITIFCILFAPLSRIKIDYEFDSSSQHKLHKTSIESLWSLL
jgi:hypothetical protein